MNELAWPLELTVNQCAFLEVYSLCGKVKTAAKDICHRACHYRWLRESDLYRENFEIAKAMRGDEILAKAQDLALEGIEEPIISRGQPVYDKNGQMLTRKRYDRTLLRKLIDLFKDPAEKPSPRRGEGWVRGKTETRMSAANAASQVQKTTQRDTLNKSFSNGYDPRKPMSVKNFPARELPPPPAKT